MSNLMKFETMIDMITKTSMAIYSIMSQYNFDIKTPMSTTDYQRLVCAYVAMKEVYETDYITSKDDFRHSLKDACDCECCDVTVLLPFKCDNNNTISNPMAYKLLIDEDDDDYILINTNGECSISPDRLMISIARIIIDWAISADHAFTLYGMRQQFSEPECQMKLIKLMQQHDIKITYKLSI